MVLDTKFQKKQFHSNRQQGRNINLIKARLDKLKKCITFAPQFAEAFFAKENN